MRAWKSEYSEALWVALLAFVSACLVATSIWENGDIELKWWAVKAWADFQFPDFPPNHHNMRWAITIPAAIWVRLTGDGAVNYLLLNHVVFALTTAGLYLLIRRLTTPFVALVALALWLVNPVAYSLPSNLMPEVYSMIYPVAALLLVRRSYETGSRWAYGWAIVMMFLAYGAKETNIFFMPGWGLYEILHRRWKNVAMIIGVFGGLLIVETLIINALLSGSHIMFGRAQAIMQAGHLSEMTTDWIYQPIDLLTRWGFNAETNFDRLEYFPKAIYWAFFILSAWKGVQWARARTLLPPQSAIAPAQAPGGEAISIAWAIGLSFAFFTTFFILSFNPLILGQPLNDRYLWPLLIPAYVVLSVLLKVWLDQTADARKGIGGFVSGLTRSLSPFASGRWVWVSLVAVAMICTLARWPIEIAAVKIRRQGFDQPYTVFDAQAYFDSARNQLLEGCTLVFPRPRPAQTILVHSFSFNDIMPTLQLYEQRLDGLMIDGHRLHGWSVPREDWHVMEGKLYAEFDNPDFFRPYAIRLEGVTGCERAYYYGQADMAPQDQLLPENLPVR